MKVVITQLGLFDLDVRESLLSGNKSWYIHQENLQQGVVGFQKQNLAVGYLTR